MPELIRFEIPEGIGDKYYKFGILLLRDKTGSRMGIIKNDCREKAEEIVQRILQEWLEGKGLPVTWESLIQTLRDINLSVLADKLEADK